MKKLAIFVEGQTERCLVERIVSEYVGLSKLVLVRQELHGGHYRTLVISYQDRALFYILVVDCQGDEKVLSVVKENYDGLIDQGFSRVIGLRDLYPKRLDELARVQTSITDNLPVGVLGVDFIIAVTEIESWFVQDDTHYHRIHCDLTLDRVNHQLGIDITKDSAETLRRPSKDLNDVYNLVEVKYKKKKGQCIRTVNALDIEHLFLNGRKLLVSLDQFLTALEGWFSGVWMAPHPPASPPHRP